MKNITKEKEYMGDTTDVFSELIEVKKEILKTEIEIHKLSKETAEITRDSGLMKNELTINRLCYANKFSDFEQKIAIYLLDGQTEKGAIEGKFKILKELLMVRRHILDIIGEVQEEKGENTNEQTK